MTRKARRRGHNEGTIYQLPNGKWRAQISLPGKRRLSATRPTRREAQAWLNKALQDKTTGTLVLPQRGSVAEFLQRWLADIMQARVSPRTYRTYGVMVHHSINPTLGDVPLQKLRAEQIQHLYAHLEARGLASGSINKAHTILKSALRQAQRWGLIAINPAEVALPPPVRQQPITVWTKEQVVQFLSATRASPLFPMYLLALTTGARVGELCALQWPAVDLDRGEIAITGTLHWQGSGYTVEPPKTRRSRRVRVPPVVVAILRQHHQDQGQPQDGFVFHNAARQPLQRETITKRFHREAHRAGLPEIRFHDLRHTAATILLSEGAHFKVVQEMLGHSSATTTLNTYAHVTQTMQDEAAARMQRFLVESTAPPLPSGAKRVQSAKESPDTFGNVGNT